MMLRIFSCENVIERRPCGVLMANEAPHLLHRGGYIESLGFGRLIYNTFDIFKQWRNCGHFLVCQETIYD